MRRPLRGRVRRRLLLPPAVAVVIAAGTGAGLVASHRAAPAHIPTGGVTAERNLRVPVDDLADGVPGAGSPGTPGSAARVPILMYHYIRVSPTPANALSDALSVPPDLFAAQMALLHADGCHTVSLGQALSSLEGGPPLPASAVVLTFDDGYADFATAAVPVLQHFGFTGTDFVVSGFLGRHRYMTADQVREVAAEGMTIGAHTVSHPDLAKMPAAAAAAEIAGSKAALETLLGRPILDFAYPAGSYNAAVVAAVQQAGFRDAVTTRPGIGLSQDGRFVLPRVRVGPGRDLRAFAEAAGLPFPGDWAAGIPAGVQADLAALLADITKPDVSPAVRGRRADPW